MKFFKENIGLKLVSVVLALLLWLIVFNVSNVSNESHLLLVDRVDWIHEVMN